MTSADRPPLTADNLSDDPAEATLQLVEQGTQTILAVDQLRQSIERATRAQNRRAVAKYILALLVIVAVIDNRLQIDRLQQLFCPLVVLNVHTPGQSAPATQRGRDVEAAARVLATRIGCDLPG